MARAPLAEVTVRTRHLPPITVAVPVPGDAEPAAADQGGVGTWLLRQLAPEVTIATPLGTWRRAPYGDPGPGTWPATGVMLGAAVLAVLALAAVGVRSLLRRH